MSHPQANCFWIIFSEQIIIISLIFRFTCEVDAGRHRKVLLHYVFAHESSKILCCESVQMDPGPWKVSVSQQTPIGAREGSFLGHFSEKLLEQRIRGADWSAAIERVRGRRAGASGIGTRVVDVVSPRLPDSIYCMITALLLQQYRLRDNLRNKQ